MVHDKVLPATAPTNPTPRPEGYHLVRWFAAISLACVLVSAAGTAVILSRFLTEHMLARDAAVSAEFLQSIVQAERTCTYFVDPSAEASRVPLESFFNHVSRLPGVVRANVFSADGTILWSSNRELIGRRFTDNDELERALRGAVVVETGRATEDDHKTEHVALDRETAGARFMEAYLPVWDAERNIVIGAVEIYRLPHALFQAIDEGVRLIWISAGLSALLLYAALTWIVARARRSLLRQQERLVEAEALAAIGAVASAVAHGVRNPLASIRSSAELAALEHPDMAQDSLADIVREADRLDGWVQDLLQQARGRPLVTDLVEVNPLIEDCGRRFGPLADRRGVRLTLAPGLVQRVKANAGPLGQALDNLIANAIEAMPDGGPLRVSSRMAVGGQQVEIAIEDSGTGMPVQPEGGWPPVFYSTKAHGTGLGLLLTRRILAGYGGALHMERRPGQAGTRAVIRLPVAA